MTMCRAAQNIVIGQAVGADVMEEEFSILETGLEKRSREKSGSRIVITFFITPLFPVSNAAGAYSEDTAALEPPSAVTVILQGGVSRRAVASEENR